MSGGAIAGIVVGGLSLLATVGFGVYLITRSPKQTANTPPPPPPPPPPQQGTDWGAMVTGIAGAATTIAGMFA